MHNNNNFCHAELIDDCQDFILVYEEDGHVICQASVNPNAPGRTSSSNCSSNNSYDTSTESSTSISTSISTSSSSRISSSSTSISTSSSSRISNSSTSISTNSSSRISSSSTSISTSISPSSSSSSNSPSSFSDSSNNSSSDYSNDSNSFSSDTILNEYCGHRCHPGKNPSTVLSGDLKRVDVSYQCGGKVVILDDCNFQVENFYLSPEPEKPAKWSCKGPGYEGLSLTHTSMITVNAVDPNAPATLSYDINNTMYDDFCHAALIEDCQDFILAYEEDGHVICQASVNPDAPGRTGSSSYDSSSGISRNSLNSFSNIFFILSILFYIFIY